MKGAQRMTARANVPSFHLSFGTVVQALPVMEYNYDVGLTNPNQNAEGYYMGCRGYTLADIAGDEDECVYQHQGTYDRISKYEGHGIEQGGQVIDALRFGSVAGLMRQDETTEAQAQTHRRGQYYYVDKVNGMDWFDSFRLAMRNTKSPLSVGTLWFKEWSFTPANGLMTANFAFDGKWDTEEGHNYKICGEKTVNGMPALIVKAWIGRILYIDREAFNRAFDIYGTAAFTQAAYQPRDIIYVKLTILQRMVQLIATYVSARLAAKFPHFYQ